MDIRPGAFIPHVSPSALAYEKGRQEALVRNETAGDLANLERYYETRERGHMASIITKMIAAADSIAWSNKTGKFVGMLAALIECSPIDEIEEALKQLHSKMLDKKIRCWLMAPALVLSGPNGCTIISKYSKHPRNAIDLDLQKALWDLPQHVLNWPIKISTSDRRTDKFRGRFAPYLSPKVFLDEWTIYMYLGYFLITGHTSPIIRMVPFRYLSFIMRNRRNRPLNMEEERIQEFVTTLLDHYSNGHKLLRDTAGENSAEAKAVSSEGLDEFATHTFHYEQAEGRSRQIYDSVMRDKLIRSPGSMYQDHPRTPQLLKYERHMAERELAALRAKDAQEKKQKQRAARILEMERRRNACR